MRAIRQQFQLVAGAPAPIAIGTTATVAATASPNGKAGDGAEDEEEF